MLRDLDDMRTPEAIRRCEPIAPGACLAPSRSIHARLFGRTSTLVAWLALAIALIHPPHGLGVRICWTAGIADVPCPGCGLTRSLSCVVRGMFAEAWGYHPFGVVFAALFVGIAVIGLLPPSDRRRVAAAMDRFSGWTTFGYAAFVASFLAYGVIRAVNHLIG